MGRGKAEIGNRSVMFVDIAWARRYDGTEDVTGNHRWLQEHPNDSSEGASSASMKNGFAFGWGTTSGGPGGLSSPQRGELGTGATISSSATVTRSRTESIEHMGWWKRPRGIGARARNIHLPA